VSRNNQVTDPAFALTLNPFNGEAAVNLVVNALNTGTPPNLEELARVAYSLISASPADARGYSVLGAIEERRGNNEAAQGLYSLALEHSKSELHALLRTAQLRLDAGDPAGALDNIDLLLRRWPAYWDQVQPVLAALASNKEAAGLLAAKLNQLPPWRSRAIAALSKDPASLGMLRDLIASTSAEMRNRVDWISERDGVIASLISNKAYTEAYALFLSTLTEQEKSVAGYVYDGKFELPPGRGYFGWRVQRPGAVDVKLGELADPGQPGLRIRFLDSPARPGVVTQNLMLPFGQYRLVVGASGSGLRLPKGLYWSIRCAGGRLLVKLPVPEGSFRDTPLETMLDVPSSDCARQVLSLDTEVRTESWRDRYQGEVRFNDIALTRL